MTIDFPPGEAVVFDRDCVAFRAVEDGTKQIRCLVSFEALHDNFGGRDRDPMSAFRAARPAVEAVARRLIERRLLEPDGTCFISTKTAMS